MSFTLATLKTAIDEYTQNTNWGSTTQIDAIIKQAEERINYAVQIANYNTRSTSGLLTENDPSVFFVTDGETSPLAPIYFKVRSRISVTATIAEDNSTVTPASMTGIVVGATVSGSGITSGTTIISVALSTFTMSLPAEEDSVGASLTIGQPDTAWSYLLMKDYNFLSEYAPIETSTGTPKYYSFYNDAQDATPSNRGTFAFAPFSSGSFDYEILYFFEPASLVTVAALDPANETWLSTHGSNALLYACLVEAYVFLKGEADLMQLYDTKFKEALQTLVMVEQGNYRTTYRNRGMRAA